MAKPDTTDDSMPDVLEARIVRLSAENTFLRQQLHEIHAIMEAAAQRLEKVVRDVERDGRKDGRAR